MCAANALDRLLQNKEGGVEDLSINFDAEVRKKNGELYSRSSMFIYKISIIALIQTSARYDFIIHRILETQRNR